MLKYPLIKFTVPFILGIVIDYIFAFSYLALMVLGILCLIILLCFILLKKYDSLITLFLIYLSILIIGAEYHSVYNIEKTTYPFIKTRYKDAIVYGQIEKIKLKQGANYKLIIQTDSIRVGKEIKNVRIKLLVRVFPKIDTSDIYETLNVGNIISITGTIKKGRTKRNPGEYDYQKYLESIGIAGLLDVYIDKVDVLDSGTSAIPNTIHLIRKKIDKTIRELHNKDTAALLRGLLLADRSSIDYELKESFVNAGVVHVLAVSGLHVGYIILIFLVLFNRVNIIYRYIFTILGLLLFLLITGSPPSVFRATIMAVVLLLTNLSSRKYNAVNTLYLAALFLLVLDPNELFSPGFQLSFSAVLSILVIFPLVRKYINRIFPDKNIFKNILLFLGVTLSAQVGTLPFTLYYFGKLSIISFIANLLVIPLIGVIVATGIITLAISSVSIVIAEIYASANELLVWFMNQFVMLFGGNDISHLTIRDFSIYDAFLFYFMILIIFIFMKYSTNKLFSFVLVFLAVSVFLIFCKLDNSPLLPEGKLSIMMIDIGQGDSFLIKYPDGKAALIDGGEADEYFDNGERVIIPLLSYLGIEKINYGFITHLDSDHLNGYLSVIDNIPIDTLYKPLERNGLQKDRKLEEILQSKNIAIKYFHKSILQIGESKMYILNDTNYIHYDSFDINNKSGIFKLVYGKNTFLFTGDIEKEAEDYYSVTYGKFLKSDLLKVGHHGSKTSTTDKFLKFVNPEYALISAGEHNRFNHPSKSVLEKLKEKNILISRTDKMRSVILCSDGENINLINWQ